jgi:hypothetical protein
MRASSQTRLLATSLAVVLAVPCFAGFRSAGAQSAALTPYPACTAKPTPQDSEAAHSAYNLGKRFFEESDYGSASHNFIDAFKLDCTKPELLLNIARANELLGNRAEAVHALETYLQRSPTMAADDKVQLQRRIDNLKAAIAAQVVVAPPTPTVAPPPTPTAAPTATTPPPPPAPPPHPCPPATDDGRAASHGAPVGHCRRRCRSGDHRASPLLRRQGGHHLGEHGLRWECIELQGNRRCGDSSPEQREHGRQPRDRGFGPGVRGPRHRGGGDSLAFPRAHGPVEHDGGS